MTNPMVDDPRIMHVRYTDFVADPVGTVGRYLAFCGRGLTSRAEDAMRTYLAANKGDRHGKFRYSTALLTDIGVDLDSAARGVPAVSRALRRPDREARLR